jgi:hypothetical protein
MIADLLPLLAFTAVLVIARNVFEAYVLDHAQDGREANERRRLHAQRSNTVKSKRFDLG